MLQSWAAWHADTRLREGSVQKGHEVTVISCSVSSMVPVSLVVQVQAQACTHDQFGMNQFVWDLCVWLILIRAQIRPPVSLFPLLFCSAVAVLF